MTNQRENSRNDTKKHKKHETLDETKKGNMLEPLIEGSIITLSGTRLESRVFVLFRLVVALFFLITKAKTTIKSITHSKLEYRGRE